MPAFKLYYFNFRGRAEIVRQLLHYGDIEYEDIRFNFEDREEWEKMKPKTPFGKVPVLEVDGKMIAESGAINRYLARLVGLYGKDAEEDADIDAIVETCEENLHVAKEVYMEKDPVKKAALQRHMSEVVHQYLDKFEECIVDEFFVGGRMTLADLYFVNLGLCPRDVGVIIKLEKYPKLQALEKRVTIHPKIAAWIAKHPVTPF